MLRARDSFGDALDLTERFLPRLRARNATPSLLCFPPYAAREVRERSAPSRRLLLAGA